MRNSKFENFMLKAPKIISLGIFSKNRKKRLNKIKAQVEQIKKNKEVSKKAEEKKR